MVAGGRAASSLLSDYSVGLMVGKSNGYGNGSHREVSKKRAPLVFKVPAVSRRMEGKELRGAQVYGFSNPGVMQSQDPTRKRKESGFVAGGSKKVVRRCGVERIGAADLGVLFRPLTPALSPSRGRGGSAAGEDRIV